MNDNNTTIKELTHTIQEFYTEQINEHKTIIKPIQIDKDTLSTLIYLLHQADKQGDITEQITTFIQEYEDEE
ncbi:hypothetical protein PXD04_10180 [Methanosphaera sp. ISO3-F5]|uniref:hypothetical protein n=1 Tax=Methanosphaera sp. ISO3-F5 TaxID=1452353 RepID=UPI002B2606DB|nr:hypothetical protein [Methanosphaera sp. ISO3-F5]WQH64057.1 hypothetical protein PXD04_10180 [Methanosphaera sp. ISO3-F5]